MLKKLEGETLPKGTASLITDIVDNLDEIKDELSDGSLAELLKM
ncbi:MAG: hypothetical protein ACQEQU_01475 [Spirochaetota bacterium]